MNTLQNALRRLGHVQQLRFGARDRIIRLFHDPDTPGAETFAVPFFGLTYRGRFDSFLDWSVFYFGAYSRDELELIGDALATLDDPIAFDIGANAGHHTLFLSRHSKMVYAFEPFPAVAAKIEGRLQENHLENVALCRFGLGEADEEAAYFPPSSTNQGTGSFLAENAPSLAVADAPLRLQLRRGDSAVRERNIERVDFIKLDVEGFEAHALRGLRETLERFRPIVFIEWTQNARKDKGMGAGGAELLPADYRFFQFIPETPRFLFFREPHYRLRPVANQWRDGNLLAVPAERIARMQARNPLPALARRIQESEQ